MPKYTNTDWSWISKTFQASTSDAPWATIDWAEITGAGRAAEALSSSIKVPIYPSVTSFLEERSRVADEIGRIVGSKAAAAALASASDAGISNWAERWSSDQSWVRDIVDRIPDRDLEEAVDQLGEKVQLEDGEVAITEAIAEREGYDNVERAGLLVIQISLVAILAIVGAHLHQNLSTAARDALSDYFMYLEIGLALRFGARIAKS